MLGLRYDTSPAWQEAVRQDPLTFLRDHACNERKVSTSAVTLAAHHPDRVELVDAMIEVAREELEHFAAVHKLIVERGHTLGRDQPDPYMSGMMSVLRKNDVGEYLLDRLLVFGVVEARGCERFHLAGEALEDEGLAEFYRDLTRSEARHHALYIRFAREYFPEAMVEPRMDFLLEHEASLVRELPIRSALH